MKKTQKNILLSMSFITFIVLLLAIISFSVIISGNNAKAAEISDYSNIDTSPTNLQPATDNSKKMNTWWLGIAIPLFLILLVLLIIYILQKKGKIHIGFLDKAIMKNLKDQKKKLTKTIEVSPEVTNSKD